MKMTIMPEMTINNVHNYELIMSRNITLDFMYDVT